jgi:hypothetical protein
VGEENFPDRCNRRLKPERKEPHEKKWVHMFLGLAAKPRNIRIHMFLGPPPWPRNISEFSYVHRGAFLADEHKLYTSVLKLRNIF